MTIAGLQFCYDKGALVVAFKVAILLRVRATRTIGIWTILNAFAFETDCFHECILLSFGICAVVSSAHYEHKPSL
jgi:hypothetical protein